MDYMTEKQDKFSAYALQCDAFMLGLNILDPSTSHGFRKAMHAFKTLSNTCESPPPGVAGVNP